MSIKKFFLFILICVSFSVSHAQQTLVYSDPVRLYNDAQDLYSKEKFGSAQALFQEYISVGNDPDLKISAQYYYAICALELERSETPVLLNDFITKYPESPDAAMATFQLGRYYFIQKDSK